MITEQVARFAVLPNKITFPFVDNIPLKVTSFKLNLNACAIFHLTSFKLFKCPQPEGVLRITVVAGRDLMRCDFGFFGSGQSDPYVVLMIGAKKFKTRIVNKTLNPVFEETWECVVENVRCNIFKIFKIFV